MANLSSLLNPAPSTTTPPPQLDRIDTDVSQNVAQQGSAIGGEDGSAKAVQSPVKTNPMTSPGLDALAEVASTFAPLTSPTQKSFSINAGDLQSSQGDRARDHSDGHRVLGNASSTGLGAFSMTGQEGGSRLMQDDAINNISRTTRSPLPQGSTHLDTSNITFTRPHLSASASPKAEQQIRIKDEALESPAERDQILHHQKLQTDFASTSNSQRVASPGTPLKTVTNASPDPSPSDSSKMPAKPKPAPSKKRPAPKKGTAAKPPPKRRKVDGNASGSPSGARTGTPATSRASNTPGPKVRKGESGTPTRDSSVMNGDEDEEGDDDDEDTELYCVCKKPDDHSVMIACDGPCEDWFHTRCVDMNAEKVDLISKWYCPNCSAKGCETLWKRKCRLEDCNRPARTDGKEKSKYCCHEHGLEFMRRRVFGNSNESPGGSRKKAKAGTENAMQDAGANTGVEYEHPKGGVLRPEELKALIDGIQDVTTFRKLGDGILTPPDTVSPEDGVGTENTKISYTSEETVTLQAIDRTRTELNEKRAMLLDRDKFITMVVARARAVLGELKEKEKSLKDICGYDARLTWTEYEFNNWRASEEGQQAMKTETLPAPTLAPPVNGVAEVSADAKTNSEDTVMKDAEEAEVGPGVCKKKRCERHRAWFKVQQQDNAMEKEEVRVRLRKLETEEKAVKDHAMIRTLESVGT